MALVDLSNGDLLNRHDAPDVTLEPDADDAALEEAAKQSVVAVEFPNFNDGRGMTLARLLRERLNFTGELRAVGTVIPDQAQNLYRCGFDTAQIEDSNDLESWKESAQRIHHLYQASSRNPFPLRHGPANPSDGSNSGSQGSGSASNGSGNRGKAGPEAAKALDAQLAGTHDIEDRIAIIADAVDGRIAFSSSLGIEDQAILDAIARAKQDHAEASAAEVDVFTLETGRLFRETEETLATSRARYGLPIRAVTPDAQEVRDLVAKDGIFGFREALENRKRCCEIRKVHPLNKALKGAGAWITGIRREQTGSRSRMPFAEWDEAHELIKINPLADWSAEELDAYIAEHDVPVNPLHDQGFPSIGCQPCTRAVQPGEDPRAGRWWWENQDKKECGLHMSPIRQSQFEDQKESQPA